MPKITAAIIKMTVVVILDHLLFRFYCPTSERVFIMLITAGPTSITKSSGKINKTNGKTSLTAVLWSQRISKNP